MTRNAVRPIRLEPVAFGGWAHCLKLTDGRTEAVVSTDVGPRILRFGFPGGPNLLKEFPDDQGKTGGRTWRIYGGHRLWAAPEDRDRTYVPDNGPVAWTRCPRGVLLTQPADARFGIRKEMRIRYGTDGILQIRHRLVNESQRTLRLAPWALTVMAPRGEARFPQEPYASHDRKLDPVRPIVLWAYTDMSDPRWTWGAREIRLRQDPRMKSPQKIGFFSRCGWMSYRLGNLVFTKRHPVRVKAVHADFGCNVETFTNEAMLELETLGPLTTLRPGRGTDHVETWSLKRSPAKTGVPGRS